MRQYRAIPIDGKDFVYGWYVYRHESDWDGHDKYIHQIHTKEWNEFIEVIPESVGQQVGEQDNKDQEIYKGDCFKTSNKHSYSSNCIAEVIFIEGAFAVQLYRSDDMEIAPELILDFKRSFSDSFEIIGNIHQHPKLLEQK